MTLLHAKEIRIFFRDETFIIDQTNGVRQGSPDSPIAFGRIVAKELDASIREASAAKDMTGDPRPRMDAAIWTTRTYGRAAVDTYKPCLTAWERTYHHVAYTSTRGRPILSTTRSGEWSFKSEATLS